MTADIVGISSMATRQILAELSGAYQQKTGKSVAIEAVGGVDAAIVFAGEEKDRGIFCALTDAMVWRIGVERPELLGVFDGAEFGDVEGAVRVEFDAQHVVYPHI